MGIRGLQNLADFTAEYQSIIDYLRTQHRALHLSHAIPSSSATANQLASTQAYQAILYPYMKLGTTDPTNQSFDPADSPHTIVNYQHGTPWINVPPFTRWFQAQRHGSPSVSGTGGGVSHYIQTDAFVSAEQSGTTASTKPGSKASQASTTTAAQQQQQQRQTSQTTQISGTNPHISSQSVGSLTALMTAPPQLALPDHNPRFPPTNTTSPQYHSCFRVDLSDVPGASFLCVPFTPYASDLSAAESKVDTATIYAITGNILHNRPITTNTSLTAEQIADYCTVASKSLHGEVFQVGPGMATFMQSLISETNIKYYYLPPYSIFGDTFLVGDIIVRIGKLFQAENITSTLLIEIEIPYLYNNDIDSCILQSLFATFIPNPERFIFEHANCGFSPCKTYYDEDLLMYYVHGQVVPSPQAMHHQNGALPSSSSAHGTHPQHLPREQALVKRIQQHQKQLYRSICVHFNISTVQSLSDDCILQQLKATISKTREILEHTDTSTALNESIMNTLEQYKTQCIDLIGDLYTIRHKPVWRRRSRTGGLSSNMKKSLSHKHRIAGPLLKHIRRSVRKAMYTEVQLNEPNSARDNVSLPLDRPAQPSQGGITYAFILDRLRHQLVRREVESVIRIDYKLDRLAQLQGLLGLESVTTATSPSPSSEGISVTSPSTTSTPTPQSALPKTKSGEVQPPAPVVPKTGSAPTRIVNNREDTIHAICILPSITTLFHRFNLHPLAFSHEHLAVMYAHMFLHQHRLMKS